MAKIWDILTLCAGQFGGGGGGTPKHAKTWRFSNFCLVKIVLILLFFCIVSDLHQNLCYFIFLPWLLEVSIMESIKCFYLHLSHCKSFIIYIKNANYRWSQRHKEGRANSSRYGKTLRKFDFIKVVFYLYN